MNEKFRKRNAIGSVLRRITGGSAIERLLIKNKAHDVIRYTTADGHVINDVISLIKSEETKEALDGLDKMADEGLFPFKKPKTVTPAS